MPKIAQYQPNQVQTQVASQPRAQGAPAGAFDNSVLKGVNDLVQSGLELKNRVDTTSSEEALVQFEREKNDLFFNPENGYFNTQGRNAYDSSTNASKALEDIKLKYGETLNSQSKQMFNQAADVHITRSKGDIARHASKGLKAWEVATIETQVENALESSSLYWNDPDRLKIQNALGEQAVIDSAEMTGVGEEAKAENLQTFRSAFANSTINAAIQSSAEEGKNSFKKYGSRLEGPDKVKIKAAIEKKERVEKIRTDATSAVLTSEKLNDQYDDLKDIINEVDKIKDVELRKKTMSEATSRHSKKRKAEAQFQSDSFESAEDYVLNGGSSEEFKIQNPDGWDSLSKRQQKNIDSQTISSTDWNTFSDLMLLPKNELAKINPTDYFDKLAKAERKSLISAVRTASGVGSNSDKVDHQVGRSRSSQSTAAVEQLFGKKSKRNNQKRKQMNAFYSLLDDEVNFRESEKEGKLTSEEYTAVLSDLTRTVVQEGRFFGTNEFDLTDIPAKDVPVISEFLRSNNIPVTADNIIKAHKQASN